MQINLKSSQASFAVTPASDTIDDSDHDVLDGDTITLTSGGTLPTPFDADAAGTVYFVLNTTSVDFQLAYEQVNLGKTVVVVPNDVSDTFTSVNHGFVDDDRVLITSTGSIPTGVTAGQQYYVINASQTTFQISTTLGGVAVNFSDTGSGVISASTGAVIDITGTGTGAHVYSSGVPIDPSSTAEVRKYALTYIAEYGNVSQESAPSLATIESVTWRLGQRVLVTSIPTGPATGNYNITRKRLYRSNVSNEGEAFQFVAEMGIEITEFLDAVDVVSEVIITTNYDMPPHDLVGIKELSNGMLIGIRILSKEICYCEPFIPHSWPVSFRRRLHDTPVGIGVYGTMDLQPFSFAVIPTEKFPYTVRGVEPSTMIMDQASVPYPCVSKRSIVDMGKYGAVYASADGLVSVGQSGIDLVTRLPRADEWVITPKQWKALKPQTIVAARWDQYYMGFFDDGVTPEGFIFDLDSRDLISLSDHASAIYLNPITGQLHIFSNSKIQSWDTGENLTATWKDKIRFSTAKASHTIARVDADTYTSVTLLVDVDRVEKVNKAVSSRTPFRINTGQLANLFELELQTVSTIRSVEIATNLEDLLGE